MKKIFYLSSIVLCRKINGCIALSIQALCLMVGMLCLPSLPAQSSSLDRNKIDRLEQTLQTRLQDIQPVKIKVRGKPSIARWEQVDAAIAAVGESLDIMGLLTQMGLYDAGTEKFRLTDEEWEQIDQIFEKHTLRYSQMFLIDKMECYFPLTNNVLRIAEDLALNDVPVYDRKGFSLGRYAGKYFFQRTGGLTRSQMNYRLTYFQYRDNTDQIRSCGDVNLLDTFSMFWPAIKEKIGYRLHSSQFDSSRRP